MASFTMCPRYFGLLRDGHQFSLLAAHSFLFRNGRPLLFKKLRRNRRGVLEYVHMARSYRVVAACYDRKLDACFIIEVFMPTSERP